MPRRSTVFWEYGNRMKKDERDRPIKWLHVVACCYMSQIGNLSKPFMGQGGRMGFQVGFQSYFSRAPMANC